jgi:hypothetical protein
MTRPIKCPVKVRQARRLAGGAERPICAHQRRHHAHDNDGSASHLDDSLIMSAEELPRIDYALPAAQGHGADGAIR